MPPHRRRRAPRRRCDLLRAFPSAGALLLLLLLLLFLLVSLAFTLSPPGLLFAAVHLWERSLAALGGVFERKNFTSRFSEFDDDDDDAEAPFLSSPFSLLADDSDGDGTSTSSGRGFISGHFSGDSFAHGQTNLRLSVDLVTDNQGVQPFQLLDGNLPPTLECTCRWTRTSLSKHL